MTVTSAGTAAWVRAEVLRSALVDAARTLAPRGIEILAIKGIYLVHALGVDACERPMLDADAVVVRGSFSGAVSALVSTGDWTASHEWSAKVLSRTGPRGGNVDLHRLPLPLFFGAMRSSEIRRRARRHPAFDNQVLVPDPDDAACMAVAHFVKDCLGLREGHGALSSDMDLLAERGRVRPEGLARRLRTHRLRRVGLVAFTALTDVEPRWQDWVDALRPSRTERVGTRAAVDILRRHTAAHPDMAFLLVRALGDDVTQGALGAAATMARLLRDRALRWVR